MNILFIIVALAVGFIASFYVKSMNYAATTYFLMAGIIALNVLEIYPGDNMQKRDIYFNLLMIFFALVQIFRLWQHKRDSSRKA